MADTTVMSPTEVAEEHQMEAHAPYLKVWFGLAVLTAVEYFYAFFLKDYFLFLILGLLFVAFVKAGMVGWYFMHLKFEGNWVYLAIVPACILATILVLALCPDQAMKPTDLDQEETVLRMPSDASSSPLHPIRLTRSVG
ncbi:MAG: cytochrome C oxidase subunit IV family protein [Isosphaeraceae bacterium]